MPLARISPPPEGAPVPLQMAIGAPMRIDGDVWH
jgi:hypothetical protein